MAFKNKLEIRHPIRSTLAVALVAATPIVATTASADAATARAVSSHTVVAHSFATQQKQLEQQLAYRVTQLTKLGSDATSSKTLTAAHLATLQATLATATSSINALVTKVPSDTTGAELAADRATMLKDNRVFAVLTPQVIEIVEADGIASQVTSLQSNQSSLNSTVTGLEGQPGYKNALAHYNAFVAAVTKASTDSANVDAPVLAQVPSDFPGDTSVFVTANHELLGADLAVARASYDESVIGLAAGGYTGS